MMKKFVYLFIAALFIGLVGCQREQSELDFGSLQEKALVTGRVTYSLGQDTLSDDYVAERILPAVGRKIYVEIPMSSYQAGAQGKKIFTGVVDSLGNFSIEVPVKSEGISGATLRYEEFTAERATYLKMENGKPVFDVRMCKFETPSSIMQPQDLLPGVNNVGNESDLRYDYAVIDMKDYSETAIFTGKLLLPYEVSFRTGAYKPAADCTVEITIQDGEDLEEKKADAEKFTYGCTTDANGVFSVNLPIKNLRKGFEIKDVTVVPMYDKAFVHYTDVTGKSVKLAGVYKLRNAMAINNRIEEIIEGVECAIGTSPLKFIPGYTNGITDPVAPQTWSNDLAGWVFGGPEFADMTATAKLTGTIHLAKEDAFAKGSYTTSAQTIQIVGPAPYDTLEVLVNADGTFELEIPIENEHTIIKDWQVNFAPEAIAFTHHVSPTKSIVIKEGFYYEYKKLRAEEAEWYQLGDYYYKFVPTSTIETWSSDLAGWVIKEGYNEKVIINASAYLAEETGFLTGKYNVAYGCRAEVTINYPEGSTVFVAPFKADGSLDLTVPIKSTMNKYAVGAFKLLDYEVEEFKHYLKDEVELVAGYYAHDKTVKPTDAEWSVVGARYYKFVPTSSVEDWSDNLIGWYVISDKKDNAQFKLYAQKAYETSTPYMHEAKWMNADKVKATVHIYELDYGKIAEFDMAVKANTLHFTLPTSYKIEANTGFKINIELEDETAYSTQFIHYNNPYENEQTILVGNYQSLNNIWYRDVMADGKLFEIKESAKMMFYDNNGNPPYGYYWDYSAEYDAN